MASEVGDRNPKKSGSTQYMNGCYLGGEVVAEGDGEFSGYNVKEMTTANQPKVFRGAGSKPNMKAFSPSLGGDTKSK